MTYAILVFISLVFLAIAIICLLLSRDDPMPNDVQAAYKLEPKDTFQLKDCRPQTEYYQGNRGREITLPVDLRKEKK
jgi:hypothetical protein